MNAFLYGVSLQWKLDIRSKTLLITCYIVPLLFFAIMGGDFHFCHARSKIHIDSVHDGFRWNNGCVDWSAALTG